MYALKGGYILRRNISILLIALMFVSQPVYAEIDTAYNENNSEVMGGYSQWAEKDIITAIEYGLLPKEMQNNYTDFITRQHFCEITYNMLKKWGVDTTSSGEVYFQDTDSEAVKLMYSLGIVNGREKNIFAPMAMITREEAATMLARLALFMGVPLKDSEAVFNDEAEISGWAKDYVYKMYGSGIMNGTDNAVFSPKQGYTKEQAIITILRLYKKA